jgi:Immunity protein 44
MKFFMSAEVQADVSFDFMNISNEIEQGLKSLETNNYGDSVEHISIISICVNLTPEFEEAGFFKERVKYSKKNKDADIRLRMDHTTYKTADMETKKLLILKNVVRSIRALQLKIKKGFDGNSLERDIIKLFQIEEIDIIGMLTT